MAIGTAAAIGLGISAAGTLASVGMNLSAAAKQSKAQSAAEQAAAEAAAKAEAEYQREFAGGVQLPMEAYQQAGREGTAQQMQALQALQESDTRSLAAGVGKVQAAATEAQTGITEQMRQDLFSLESTQMQEKMSNRDQIARMNEERAMGAQKAAANAQAAKTAAITGAISGVTSLAGQALQAAPLYGNNATPADIGKGFTVGDTTGMGSTINPAQQSIIGDRFGAPAQASGPTSSFNISALGQMNNPNMVSGVTAPRKTLSQLQKDAGSWYDNYVNSFDQ
jgi:hypothetical protein